MIRAIVKNHPLVIVGQHFFWRGRLHQRIGLNSYSNAEELEALFLENSIQGPEDYQALSIHEDPIVRQLVAANLEQLETLQMDANKEVASMASLYHTVLPASGQVYI
ncbi:hypothetical protein CZP2022_226 [Vibrio phage C-ZP2022]|nr:hypothetical protein CZP2022_226 [Vibrio phage C-ZP2022]